MNFGNAAYKSRLFGTTAGVLSLENTNRKTLIIQNNDTLYKAWIGFGREPTQYDGLQLNPNGGTFTMDELDPIWKGKLFALGEAADTHITIIELTQ